MQLQPKEKTGNELIADYFNKEIKPKLDIKRILSWKKSLISAFGEENIQITTNINEIIDGKTLSAGIVNPEYLLGLGRSLEFYVIIKFNKITVENSKREKRVIEDIYVKIYITRDYQLRDLQAIVPTLTKESFYGGYAHSHIPSQNNITNSGPSWSHVCLGTGPLSLMITKHSNLTENEFKLLIYNIREFIKWESIEGTPYIRLNQVKNRALSTTQRRNNISDHWKYSLGSIVGQAANIYPKDITNFSIRTRDELGKESHKQYNSTMTISETILELFKDNPSYLLDNLDININDYFIQVIPNEKLELFIFHALDKIYSHNRLDTNLTLGILYYLDHQNNQVRYHSPYFHAASSNIHVRNQDEGLLDLMYDQNILFTGSGNKKDLYPKVSHKALNKVLFKFKGKDVKYTIIDNDSENETEQERTEKEQREKEKNKKDLLERIKAKTKNFKINKNLVNYVSEFLSDFLTKQLTDEIRNYKQSLPSSDSTTGDSDTESASAVINIRESSVTDQVPLS